MSFSLSLRFKQPCGYIAATLRLHWVGAVQLSWSFGMDAQLVRLVIAWDGQHEHTS